MKKSTKQPRVKRSNNQKTLLERALEVSIVPKDRKEIISEQEIDLILAYYNGKISLQQIAYVFGYPPDDRNAVAKTRAKIEVILSKAVRSRILLVEKSKDYKF